MAHVRYNLEQRVFIYDYVKKETYTNHGEEKLDDVGNRLENSAQKSLWRLAQESGVSVGSAWTETKLLHIHPYKITVVPEIKPMDYEKRVRFCNWFINRA
jgi:hypothetical protein